jgi:hypothetical protein
VSNPSARVAIEAVAARVDGAAPVKCGGERQLAVAGSSDGSRFAAFSIES